MLKKIKAASSAKKKARMVKKSVSKAVVVKGAKAVKLKKSVRMAKPAKMLKADKLINSVKVKAGKAAKMKKTAVLKKAAVAKSVKMAPAVSKALGTLGLQKQWARAKKAHIKAIQAEIKHANHGLQQDLKTIAAAAAPKDAVAKAKALRPAAKAKAKKLAQAAKLQKAAMLKLQKKVGKAQKALAQLKQLLLKARAMNKLLSQFDKEWKAPAEVVKPKKAEKLGKADKAKLKKAAKGETVSRRGKKMTSVAAVNMSFDDEAEDTAITGVPNAEAA